MKFKVNNKLDLWKLKEIAFIFKFRAKYYYCNQF